MGLPFRGSHSIFNGSDPCLDPSVPVPRLREIVVNIPAAYKDGDAAPVLVLQDGSLDVPGGAAYILEWIVNAQSNLIDSSDPDRRLPAFITVTVQNGAIERSLEYCQMSDRYARFVSEEVLPAVLRNEKIRRVYPNINFTSNPDGRAALGCSSGGAAALTMGYFRPDLFRRIGAYSPSAVDLQYASTPEARLYPKGGWEYHSDMRLLETHPQKSLRVFVSNAENDLYAAGKCPSWVNTSAQAWHLNCCFEAFCADGEHNWALAGKLTAFALKEGGYIFCHVYALVDGDGSVKEGDRVQYLKEFNLSKERFQAKDVRVDTNAPPSGGDVEPVSNAG